jgi:lipopolysaccharide transport system ATP-binding protein
VLFVSHNMSAIKSLCTRAILIEHGRITFDGSTDEVVNRYLQNGAGSSRTGVIPDDAPRYRDIDGEATLRAVRLTDTAGTDVTQLYFGQPFRVGIECDVHRDVVDGHFEVSISTLDGIHVTYSTTIDGGAPPRHIPRGRHVVWAEIDAVLLPRDYTIDVAIHHHEGNTCDYVRQTLDFTVLRVAENGDDHYRWRKTRGYVRAPARWELGSLRPSTAFGDARAPVDSAP